MFKLTCISSIKKKIIYFISTVFIIFTIILNSQFLKIRYVDQIQSYFTSNQIYFELYKQGLDVFKNHKIFGVGNKNYRIETCKIKKDEDYYCITHPHQIYIEILSEHGLVGAIIIFFILYKLIFSKIRETIKENNYIQIGSLIYLILIFLPLLPTGAFFSDYMLTLFAINLSIFYGSSKKLNIFYNQK